MLFQPWRFAQNKQKLDNSTKWWKTKNVLFLNLLKYVSYQWLLYQLINCTDLNIYIYVFQTLCQIQLLDHSESSGEDETQKHQQKIGTFWLWGSELVKAERVYLHHDLKEVNSIQWYLDMKEGFELIIFFDFNSFMLGYGFNLLQQKREGKKTQTTTTWYHGNRRNWQSLVESWEMFTSTNQVQSFLKSSKWLHKLAVDVFLSPHLLSSLQMKLLDVCWNILSSQRV